MTVRSTHLKALLAEVGISLLIVGILEVAFSQYVHHHPELPMPRLFLSSIDTGKYLSFRRWFDGGRPLDTLLMGLSPMMRVDGHVLHDVLQREGHDVTVFNFAGPYHGIPYDQRMLEDIIFRISKPKLIVYGVTPISILHEERPFSIDDLVANIPAFRLHDGRLATTLYGMVLINIRLVAYREVIREMLTPGHETRRDPFAASSRATDRFGGVRLSSEPLAWDRLRMNNEQKLGSEFKRMGDPNAGAKLFPRLQEFARFCQRHDVRVVLLNNAVHPRFLDLLPGGQRDYERFVERLRAVADQSGMRFFDPAGAQPSDPILFNDAYHHNNKGADWITTALAEYLVKEKLLPDHTVSEREVDERLRLMAAQ